MNRLADLDAVLAQSMPVGLLKHSPDLDRYTCDGAVRPALRYVRGEDREGRGVKTILTLGCAAAPGKCGSWVSAPAADDNSTLNVVGGALRQKRWPSCAPGAEGLRRLGRQRRAAGCRQEREGRHQPHPLSLDCTAEAQPRARPTSGTTAVGASRTAASGAPASQTARPTPAHPVSSRWCRFRWADRLAPFPQLSSGQRSRECHHSKPRRFARGDRSRADQIHARKVEFDPSEAPAALDPRASGGLAHGESAQWEAARRRNGGSWRPNEALPLVEG